MGWRELMAVMAAGLFLVGPQAAWANEADELLPEVVVTATRTPVAPGLAPQEVQVVERKDLETAGERVAEALQRLPEVQVNVTGTPAMAALPTIRGSQPGQVLVLLDGRRLNSQQAGWFNLNDLPLIAGFLERAEVLTASASALYGADAMGGVVNLITRDPATLPRAGLRFLYGAEERLAGEAFVAPTLGPARVALGVGRDTGEGFRANSDWSATRWNVLAGIPGESSALNLDVEGLRKEIGSPGPEAFPSPHARQWDDVTLANLSYERAFAGGATITARLFHNRARREYDDPDFFLHSRHVTRGDGVMFDTVWEGGRWGRWLGGVEIMHDELESSNDGNRSLDRTGFCLQDELGLTPALALVLTGRLDLYSTFAEQFSPRAALVYHPADTLTLRASASRGYRTPTFDDLYWNDPYARGNPDLSPERSWDYDLSVTSRPVAGVTLELDGFRRDIEDLIVWADADGDWVWTPSNIASARVRGFTAGAQLNLGEHLEAGIDWTRLDTKDLDSGQHLPGRPRTMLKGHAALSGAYGSIEVSSQWIDRTPAPGLSTPGYALTDLRLARIFVLPDAGPFTLALTVRNLFDRDYQAVAGYPMPGREAEIEASWSF